MLGNANSKNIAQFLYEDVICWHGCFQKLICDGGPENQKLVKELMDRYKVKNVEISPYHPEVNGVVESGHQPIINALSKIAPGRKG